jgi:ATP-dependent helicase/nuclease subunit A
MQVISDALARSEALNPEASFIVQAPAGSGKTGLLVYRMLTLLATVEQPQQVLAITFTRKATSELRERVLELINRAHNNQKSNDGFEQQGIDLAWVVVQRDKQLGWNLLNSPHQLQILTIDAFCARLTTSMPWLSRLGDKPRTTDNAEKHYAAAVEQLFSELLQGDSKLTRCLQTVMLEMDFDYNRARRLFVSMLAKRDQWLRHLLGKDLYALQSSLEYAWLSICNEQLAALSGLIGEHLLTEIVELAKQAAANIEPKQDQDSPLKGFEAFDKSVRLLGIEQWKALRIFLCGKGTTIRKQVNKTIGFPKGDPNIDRFKSLLSELADDDVLRDALIATDHIPTHGFSKSDWEYLISLEEVLKSLAGLLQLQFRAAGECDHSEVGQRANLALQELDNPTDLALRMDYQLQHILVDEFQDTSHGQIELLKRLTEGWSEDQGKTLFLVGDPMQSIYRFREADVSLFLRVAENATSQVFDNVDIRSLTLSENFRSSTSLVNWFNNTFQGSFPKANDVLSGAIRYSSASSNSSIEESENAVVTHLTLDKEDEAQATVAAVLKAIQALPNDQARVALLVRARSQLKTIVPALQANGVAYQGVDIQPLQDQQAVIDVVALLKALCREDDRVSWMALLRGPWCGLTLSELIQLLNDKQRTIWQQLSQITAVTEPALESDSWLRLRRFLNVMGQAMQQRQQVDLANLTRWTWQALGGEATLFGVAQQDVETVFDLIQDLQRGGDLPSLTELDQAIERLYAEPSGDPTARLIVSTMHKAKGLQYHTVILPTLSRSAGANNKEMMMWAEHQSSSGQSQLLLAPLRLEDKPGSHYHYLRELDKQRAANEAIRLMYVACTRAEEKLILLSHLVQNQESGEIRKPASNTLLASIWSATEAGFIADCGPAESVKSEVEDDVLDQTLSRLPADYQVALALPINWQAANQLSAQEPDAETAQIQFEWSTEVATAVGVVMHGWLQFNQSRLYELKADDQLRNQWRAELRALRVPSARLAYGVERLCSALQNIQNDSQSAFLFADYPDQNNEYSIGSNEQGLVKTFRIDRTFVDQNNTRWIVDYKTTLTHAQDIDLFVDEQIEKRHRPQLQHYGALMSKLDDRPIKLAIYFPMLGKLRSWDYQA